MQSSEKFADAPAAQVLRGIALIFPRTLFYEKTTKTLCVTIRNFVSLYFVFLYAKITRFLINERRTYPYIQVGSFSVPSLAPLAPARKPCGYARRRVTFRAPDFTHLHTDFRQFHLYPRLRRNRPQIALFAADPLGEPTRYFLRAGVFRLWFSHIIRAALRSLVFPPTLPADCFRLPSQ